MKILLLEPLAPSDSIWGSFSKEKGLIPPIGLLSINAYLLEQGYDVTFVDTQFEGFNTHEQIKELLLCGKFDLIGIPVLTTTAIYSFSTAKLCKQVLPKSRIVLGSVHASALPEQTMRECPDADFIIRGEGEFTIVRLIEHLEGKGPGRLDDIAGLVFRRADGSVQVNSPPDLIKDLGVLPANIYLGVECSKYVPHPGKYKRLPSVSLVTQRGCPFQCTFCDAHLIHGRNTRLTPVEKIVEQIQYLVEDQGVKDIQFQDSTFTLNRRYTEKLLNILICKSFDLSWGCITRVDCVDADLIQLMKEAGCWQIAFGIESGNQETLDLLKKGTRITIELMREIVAEVKRQGILVENSFILGLPNEDEKMVENTIRFAKEIRPHKALFYLPVPYPGTKLFEDCERSGGLREDATWEDYLAIDYDNPVYINPKLGKEKMKYYYKKAWRGFYLSPFVWWDNLRLIKTPDDIYRYYRGLRALLGLLS